MIEIHPFENFVPSKAKYLLLGTFCTKPYPGYEFFYANKRNQFWSIVEDVYGVGLETTDKKKKLFTKLKIAISDVIASCERTKGNHSDNNLKIVSLNNSVGNILKNNKIEKIFFSSRFAEGLYRKYFKNLISEFPKVELITLPSPSPRYAKITRQEKVALYKQLLP